MSMVRRGSVSAATGEAREGTTHVQISIPRQKQALSEPTQERRRILDSLFGALPAGQESGGERSAPLLHLGRSFEGNPSVGIPSVLTNTRKRRRGETKEKS